jgi:hypothetical protein
VLLVHLVPFQKAGRMEQQEEKGKSQHSVPLDRMEAKAERGAFELELTLASTVELLYRQLLQVELSQVEMFQEELPQMEMSQAELSLLG